MNNNYNSQEPNDNKSDDLLSPEDAAFLEAELKRAQLDELIIEKNIALKHETGYFETTSVNELIDEWRKTHAADYSKKRREKREKKAASEGRVLRSYEPATPDGRRKQLLASKAKARLDPDYKEQERARDREAKAAERRRMTVLEREEVNRVRREKRAAKKAAAK